nr:MAG TPA: hypothetical protein [Bacteriophage sp.]
MYGKCGRFLRCCSKLQIIKNRVSARFFIIGYQRWC